MKKLVSAVVRTAPFFLALAACEPTSAFYLYSDGGTVSRTDSDYFECEVLASREVPQNTKVATTPTYTTPTSTQCYNTGYSVQCTTTGGQTYGGDTYSYDTNAELRAEFFARCMVARGYQGFEMLRCDPEKVPQSVLQELTGRLRPPSENACYIALTKNAGNVVYANELVQ